MKSCVHKNTSWRSVWITLASVLLFLFILFLILSIVPCMRILPGSTPHSPMRMDLWWYGYGAPRLQIRRGLKAIIRARPGDGTNLVWRPTRPDWLSNKAEEEWRRGDGRRTNTIRNHNPVLLRPLRPNPRAQEQALFYSTKKSQKDVDPLIPSNPPDGGSSPLSVLVECKQRDQRGDEQVFKMKATI